MTQTHVFVGAASVRPIEPAIRRLDIADLKDALRRGWDDFAAMPSHALFLCVIYPVVGVLLAQLTLGYSTLHVLFPLAAGFALIGPLAAIGLYELSRRREAGLESSALDALDVLHSRSVGAIAALGLLLTAIFVTWLAIAHAIYVAEFGYAAPASVGQFLRDIFTTAAGWKLIAIGNGVGFLFAVLVLTISAISFPLLLDRDVGAAGAVLCSVRVVLANPRIMALWGLIVAALLFVGSLPFFAGLAVVMPVLGHATWHLYRKAVDAEGTPRAEFRHKPHRRRYAADFPAALFR